MLDFLKSQCYNTLYRKIREKANKNMYGKQENPDNIPGINNVGKFLVLDVETGGTDPKVHSILSMAMVALQKGEVLDELEIFIAENKTEVPEGASPVPMVINPDALLVNNLDAEWIHDNGLAPREAFYKIEYFLNKNFRAPSFNNLVTIMGHNVNFDIEYFKRLLRLAKVRDDWYSQRFTKHYVDTLPYVVMMDEAFSSTPARLKLSNCLERFEIDVEGESHNALVDAHSTAKLFTKLCRTINPNYPQ